MHALVRPSNSAVGVIVFLFAAMPTFFGCISSTGMSGPLFMDGGAGAEVGEFSMLERQGLAEQRAMPASAAPSGQPVALASLQQEQRDVPVTQRKVVYTADYRIVVGDLEGAIKSTEQLAASAGGYLQRITGDSITIRVPVERFEEVTDQIESMGRVSRRNIQASDITEQFVDLEARLRNARAVAARLNELLARAENVQAALAVEKELNRVNEQIERFEARLALLQSRIAMSTITVTFERIARPARPPGKMGTLPFAWLKRLDPSYLWR